MIGSHCIKTWSVTQGAYALSSAEAEFYAMIEGVTRAKGYLSLARELGFDDMTNVVHLGTDSSAAKSFVSRRGLGKMRHLEIRDLWLQKEVREGRVEVNKIPGAENPADLMTKILSFQEVKERLRGMNTVMYKRGRDSPNLSEIHCVMLLEQSEQLETQLIVGAVGGAAYEAEAVARPPRIATARRRTLSKTRGCTLTAPRVPRKTTRSGT